MKKKKIKIIIVGLGQIGYLYNYNKNIISTHTQAIFSLKEKVDFFAVIEKKRRIRINFEKKFNVPALSKIEELKKIYDKSSDYLFILSTNTPTHYLILKKILKFKPKYILCEKPFCSSIKEVKNIIKINKKYNSKIFINYTRSFDKKWLLIKKNFLINKNVLGEVFYNKTLLNNGSHFLHLCFTLFGSYINIERLNKKKFKIYFKNNIEVTFLENNKRSKNKIILKKNKMTIEDSGNLYFKITNKNKKYYIKNTTNTYQLNPLKAIVTEDTKILKNNLKNSIMVQNVLNQFQNIY
jgi:hypothetical protein